MKEEEPNIVGIGTEEKFAIGQRALLVATPQGNVLFDCLSYIDEQTIQAINEKGWGVLGYNVGV